MGDRLPVLLQNDADWTTWKGNAQEIPAIQLVAILTTEIIQARREKVKCFQKKWICPQSRQSNKAEHWFLWESWASNRGIVHRFFTTFLSTHPFSYSSDSEKNMNKLYVFYVCCPWHDCSPKILLHALLSWHLVMSISLSKFDGWRNIWLWASIEASFAMPGTKIHAASRVRSVVFCHLFCIGFTIHA